VEEEKPQPKDPTLVGVGQVRPSGTAVVVGAVGPRAREPVHASETQRWIFEPKAEGSRKPVAEAQPPTGDTVDEGWPEDPPPPSEALLASAASADADVPDVAAEASVAIVPPPVVAIAEAKVEPAVEAKVEPAVETNVEPAVETKIEPAVETKVEPPAKGNVKRARSEPAPPLPVVERLASVPDQSPGRSRWLALLALLLIAVGAGAWWFRSAHAVAARATPTAPTASERPTPEPSGSAAATALPSASTSARPTEATPAPAPTDSSATPEPTASFDARAAKRALDATAKAVANCRRGKTFGAARATVTFGNDGVVSSCTLGASFAGTAAGACVTEALSAVHVPPFRGKPGVVVHRFVVTPKHSE
jgi:hypothetical protein